MLRQRAPQRWAGGDMCLQIELGRCGVKQLCVDQGNERKRKRRRRSKRRRAEAAGRMENLSTCRNHLASL